MQKQIVLLLMAAFLGHSSVNGQELAKDSIREKFFIGSSLFMLGNLDTRNSPDFVQINFGYRLTPGDVLSVEFKTWKYGWPLGIPYGDSFEAPNEKYPGFVRAFGMALVYQRFLWKGAYTAVHAFNAKQTYVGENSEKIQNGYQLFMTYRLGYHFRLFKSRFFVEPSLAVTHWPINTNVPESFRVQEDNWPNYFLLEPGLHFGFRF